MRSPQTRWSRSCRPTRRRRLRPTNIRAKSSSLNLYRKRQQGSFGEVSCGVSVSETERNDNWRRDLAEIYGESGLHPEMVLDPDDPDGDRHTDAICAVDDLR